eukprot:GILK01006186.1.p1 GENE.GILK01006186.1~~GILK01006186.1.p1  ORF type:complete len:1042 (-),score=202.42 GILK01006186.1:164-3166(-)
MAADFTDHHNPHEKPPDAEEMARIPKDMPGLTEEEAAHLLRVNGPNELPEKRVNPLLHFLSFYWGPMPIMIWIAVLLEGAQTNWLDFGVLLALQFLNGIVSWNEERNAGNAVAALKKQLASRAIVKRDGQWKTLPARDLVVSDVIALKLGFVVPADAKLLGGESVEIDQAALTGESLPVTQFPGGVVYQGSVVKRGEISAVVTGTGKDTFFGKTSTLVSSVQSQGNIQKVVWYITLFLLIFSLVLVVIIFFYLFTRPDEAIDSDKPKWLSSLAICVVLLVASIPIATPVVVTSTMAVGAHRLTAHRVIISRLSAIEELAGMNMLCSDKTGTLTKNELTLYDPFLLGGVTAAELSLTAALCSKREAEGQDAIDSCITHAAAANNINLEQYEEIHFVPFDPMRRRTEATVKGPDGQLIQAAKGAPQVILAMSKNVEEIKDVVQKAVKDFASRGYRTLGVAKTDEDGNWVMMGLLSLFDPPRDDTADTLKKAFALGIKVKMITGDQTAIAKETARALGMNDCILNAEALTDKNISETQRSEIVDRADGFAEVFPEQKFQIVEMLQKRGYRCGMTGDGVNDAPALKKAEVGIAVSGATDAARGAADIVLTLAGLSVIIDAIIQARKIFNRIRNYLIYRIACTLQLLVFFFISILGFNPSTYGKDGNGEDVPYLTFRLPVIALVIITVLNDGSMITCAYDYVIPGQKPERWNLKRDLIMSSVLGGVACISSLVWLHVSLCCMAGYGILVEWFNQDAITFPQVLAILYLKISLSDFLTVFSARTEDWFWTRKSGNALLLASIFATLASTFLAVYWPLNGIVPAEELSLGDIPWAIAGITWLYCILWWLLQDIVKVYVWKVLYAWERKHEAQVEQVKAASPEEEFIKESMSSIEVAQEKTILSSASFIAANRGKGENKEIMSVIRTVAGTDAEALLKELNFHRLQKQQSASQIAVPRFARSPNVRGENRNKSKSISTSDADPDMPRFARIFSNAPAKKAAKRPQSPI